ATGITFEGSRGGATIGVVVGFDAAGRTVEGTLALVGDELEMRLPAAFVETATAPITVDPLIGPTTTVDSGSEYYPDVAYSSGNDLWMVVWHRYVSSSDSDIRAQKLWADGTLYDVGVGVRTGTEVSQRPRIAYNRYQGTMVVAWEEAIGGGQRDIYARTVKLTTNPLGTVYTVSSFTDDEFDVDVGGNLGSVGASKDRIVVGWNRLDPNDPDGAAVWAKSFDVDGTSGVLTPNGLTTSVGAIHADARRISIADATPDRQAWMMVWDTWHVDWTTNTAWIDGARDLYCELYDTDLHGLGGGMTLVADGYSVVNGSVFWYQAGGAKCLEPSIAGDGNRWFVAYSLAEGLSGLPHSIAGAAIEYGGGVVSVPYAFRTIALGAGDQTGPSVAWMPNSVLVAYLDEPTSGVVDPWLWTGDFDCKQCGSAVQIASTGDCRQVRIASRVGGSTSYALDEALITYFDDSGATEAVIADRFRSDDGLFENIGGGCGSGTNVEQFSQCAVVGHADHVIHLLDAPADTAALLLLGFDPFSSQCGSCELKINPFEAFAFALTTDGNGEAIAPLPISQSAGLLGLSFYHQWLIDNPSTAGCAAVGSDFTDAIRVTIQ
ncbi:MAG: hypothetical protein KDE27_14310, partial [Planctomycetes bacterium]|nr:hypothetical protein [Planctomycetota bacterium]